jgi:hypothetical protein
MEYQTLQLSLVHLNKVVQNRLLSIPDTSSIKEIRNINRFLRESQRLRETIASMMPADVEYETEEMTEEEERAQTSMISVLTQACEIIAAMYKVVDHKQVKKDKLEWVCEDACGFLAEMRHAFGKRIPAVPGSMEGENV